MVSNNMVHGTSGEASKCITAGRLQCTECGAALLTHTLDRDKQNYIWCRLCGLVYDPKHRMGSTVKSLLSYMKKKKMSADDQRRMHDAYKAYGLRAARITVGRILNNETFPSQHPDQWDAI